MKDFTDYTKWYQAVVAEYDDCLFERDSYGSASVWSEDLGIVAFWEGYPQLGWINYRGA